MPEGERSSRGEKARQRRPAAPPWRQRASQRADGLRRWPRSSTLAPATESQRGLSRCRRQWHGADGQQQARSGRREDERDNESSRWTTWCCRARFVNLHFYVVFLEGVYLDRTEAGLKPRFVKGEPPSNVDIAEVLQKISHRVIRTLRRLGYLEAGTDDVVATGHDPLYERPNSPAPWRPPYSSAWPLASG